VRTRAPFSEKYRKLGFPDVLPCGREHHSDLKVMLPCGREHILTFVFSRFLGERFFIVFGTVLAPFFGAILTPWRSLGAALGSGWIPKPSLSLLWVAPGCSLVRFSLFVKVRRSCARELHFHSLGYDFGTLEGAISIPGGSDGTLHRTCWLLFHPLCPPGPLLENSWVTFFRLRK